MKGKSKEEDEDLFPLFCRKYEEIYNEKTSEYLASFTGVLFIWFLKLQKHNQIKTTANKGGRAGPERQRLFQCRDEKSNRDPGATDTCAYQASSSKPGNSKPVSWKPS
jgi:hypothetical protein